MKQLLWIIKIVIPFLLITISDKVFGQEPAAEGDSVHIPLGYMVVITDTTLRFGNDTTVFFPKNTSYKIKKDKDYRSKEFYSGFKDKSHNNVLLKGLYDVTVREQRDTTKIKNDQLTENYHPEDENKIVGRIEIFAVDIIDGDVNDTSVEVRSGYARTLNKLHDDTRKATLRKNLTLKEGDVLGAYTVSDNEYFIRSLKYIEDAKIVVIPDSLNPEIVTVLLVVKDLFPITFGFGMGGITDYTLGVNSINIAGTGTEFSNSFRFNNSNSPPFGYVGELAFKNLWGSFVDAYLLYKNNANEELSRFTLVREFITPETKYGGGIEWFQQKTAMDIAINDTEVVNVPYTKNYVDQWLGRSFLYNKLDRKSFIMKGRYMRTDYSQRPEVESDSNQQFYTINLLIGSLTLLKKNHYKERMLLGYGMVEDIDYGYAFELTYGYQFSEYFDAPYLGFSVKAANKYNFGYLGGGIEFGGHIYHNTIAQGLFRTGFSYYTPLLHANHFDYRMITRVFYTEGIRRYPYDYINLGKEVRGISNSGLEGNRRLTARFEFTTFLEGNVIGFRFSPNLFYDAAYLSNSTKLISKNNYFSGIGLGVRIRNEHLAFPTIIIRVAYYTGNPVKSAHFGAGFTTSVPDVFKDYIIAEPDILRY